MLHRKSLCHKEEDFDCSMKDRLIIGLVHFFINPLECALRPALILTPSTVVCMYCVCVFFFYLYTCVYIIRERGLFNSFVVCAP